MLMITGKDSTLSHAMQCQAFESSIGCIYQNAWRSCYDTPIALPEATPEMQQAWAAFDDEAAAQTDAEEAKFAQELVWAKQQPFDVLWTHPTVAKACELYVRAVQDAGAVAEVAKKARTLSQSRAWKGQQLARTVRVIAMARFRSLWRKVSRPWVSDAAAA